MISFLELPKYCDIGTTKARLDLERVKIKIIEINKQMKIASRQESKETITPRSEELITEINNTYSKLKRNLREQCLLFLRCREFCLIEGNNELTKYNKLFSDLDMLNQIINDEENEYNNMLLQNITKPYLECMMDFINVIHKITNAFYSNKDYFNDPIKIIKKYTG